MIEITIDTSRAQGLINGSALMRRAQVQAAEESAIYTLNQLKQYPSSTGGSYRRTGTLRRSWHHEVFTTTREPSARVSSNGNIAPYNRWVQDQTRQARMHRGRWNTAQQVAHDSVDTVVDFYRTRIRRNFDI